MASTKKSSMRGYDVKLCVNRKSEPCKLHFLCPPLCVCIRKHYTWSSFQNRPGTSSSVRTSDLCHSSHCWLKIDVLYQVNFNILVMIHTLLSETVQELNRKLIFWLYWNKLISLCSQHLVRFPVLSQTVCATPLDEVTPSGFRFFVLLFVHWCYFKLTPVTEINLFAKAN